VTDNFYRAFEDKHRGSRQLIKERLRVYLPFIAALRGLCQGAQAIDLGCGRGEWLELLSENGFDARGVDLDDGMLAACRELGLKVENQDAIAALQALPDDSQMVVSGFHIAEHLPFEVLQNLVKQAHRVLKPAGLLILETPNPENILVGTAGFYTDPTHQRPLPSALLEFLPEYFGFLRIKTLRLQEQGALATKPHLDLMDVLGGSSPDYAVVAQKSADQELVALTAAAFEPEYGLALGLLASRYDGQRQEQLQQALSLAEGAITHADRIDQLSHDRTQQALSLAEGAIAHANRIDQLSHERTQLALNTVEEIRAHSAQTHAALHAVLHSRSWRLTFPLRWLGHQARRLRDEGLASRTKALARKLIRPLARQGIKLINTRPRLRRACVALAHRLGLYHALRSLYFRLSRPAPATPSRQATPSETQVPPHEDSPQLSDRVMEIYSELKRAIAVRKSQGGQ
jgi:O-antigen chain-terminating methyltransferase